MTEAVVTPDAMMIAIADRVEDELEVSSGLAEAVAEAIAGGEKLECVRVLAAMEKPTRLSIVIEAL